ncbi:MAG: hypothetical protein ACOCVF_02910 [bacterium]
MEFIQLYILLSFFIFISVLFFLRNLILKELKDLKKNIKIPTPNFLRSIINKKEFNFNIDGSTIGTIVSVIIPIIVSLMVGISLINVINEELSKLTPSSVNTSGLLITSTVIETLKLFPFLIVVVLIMTYILAYRLFHND